MMTTLWIAAAVVFAIPQEAGGQDTPRPVRLGPIAVVSDFLHDFGTVTAGPVLEHTFVVANTGTNR
ncbi:MAG: hypothetical protein KJ057_17295 [Phycisphaerae bacterium]|nr:MAG: DUF1573 domain-containing protein [Phycisphaerae bacterium]MCL4720221.1 hypothetical protein [Phycisphaerae bacterium]NUQ10692.1 hypothetical protein [Phycisphaerae bacterium]